MGGDQVNVLGQLWVFLPDMPLLGGGHRYFDRSAHPIQQNDQRFRGDLFAKQRLVADHHAHDASGGVGQLDGFGDFPFVAFLVRADPDAEGDAQAEFLRQFRDVSKRAVDRIDTNVVGQLAHDFQVTAHFVVRRILILLWELPLLEWRIREAGDLLRPVRRRDRAIDQRPETGEQGSDGQHHHQVESKFTR